MENAQSPEPSPRSVVHRTRWAAIGAAIAVSLGAGGFGVVNAVVNDSPKNVFVAINPCRLADTRAGSDNVGPRSTPIAAQEVWTVAGTGDVAGPCNIPNGVNALELNVTALNATVAGFLTFYPTGAPRPTASNLNPTPGQPPVPNSVTVTLADDGKFNVFSHAGTTDVVIDVVGYYDDHRHNARDISDEPGLSFNDSTDQFPLTTATVAVVTTAIRAPADGFLDIQATISWHPTAIGWNQLECELTLGSTTMNTVDDMGFFGDEATAASSGSYRTQNLHTTVPISAANNPLLGTSGQIVRVLCREVNGAVVVDGARVTATYYPSEYEPSFVVFPVADGDAGG